MLISIKILRAVYLADQLSIGGRTIDLINKPDGLLIRGTRMATSTVPAANVSVLIAWHEVDKRDLERQVQNVADHLQNEKVELSYVAIGLGGGGGRGNKAA